MKLQQAHEYAVKYIQQNLGDRGTLTVTDGKLSSSDFEHLQKIMNFYAKAQIYDIKISSQKERVPLL